MNKKYQKQFNENRSKFNKNQIDDILDNYDDLHYKFEEEGRLKKFLKQFEMLFSMLKDYFFGVYTEIPWYIIAAIGSSLLYVLSPVDAIPDFIPGIGYIDDAAVVALCLNFVRLELEEYKKWKFGRSN